MLDSNVGEKSAVDQPSVLIISDVPSFPTAITSRWQALANSPAFTLMQGAVCEEFPLDSFDLAVVGDVQEGSLKNVLRSVQSGASPVLIVGEFTNTSVRGSNLRFIPKSEAWPENAILVASEMLARHQAEVQLGDMQEKHVALESQAALGRYMLEMRHSLNNALTSVLGNSELLLLDSSAYSPAVQLQFETIRNMAIRMHEIFQRFTSLEKELKATRKPSGRESSGKEQITSAGM